MPTVVIRPTVVEYGVNRAAYDEFVAALRAEGIDARVDQPPERRDGGLQHSAVDVAIYLFENAGNVYAASQIAKIAVQKLGKRRPPQSKRPDRRGAIFDQDAGETHEIVLERD